MSAAGQEEDKKPADQGAHINLKVKGQVRRAGRRIIFRGTSDAEVQIRIDAALDPLTAAGVSLVDANTAGIVELFWTISAFEKHVRILKNVREPRLMLSVIEACKSKHMISNVFGLTLKEIIHICSWMRTSDGQTTVTSIQRRLRLEKRGRGECIAWKIDLKKIFDTQNMDMANKCKQVREASEKKITALRAQILAAEEERDMALGRIARTHPTAASFKCPPAHEIGRRAWELYVADCQAKGVVPECTTDASILRVVDEYGEEVKEEYIYKHIGTDEGKKSLENWWDQFIKLLAPEDEEEHAREGPSGETKFKDLSSELHKIFFGIGDTQGIAGEGGDGEQAMTEPIPEHGAESEPPQSFGKKRKNLPPLHLAKSVRK